MHSHLAKMLGQYILDERTEQNILQWQLAEKLEMSAQFLGRIEKGEVMMPEDALAKCIKLLSLDREKILTIYRLGGEERAKMILSTSRSLNKIKKMS